MKTYSMKVARGQVYFCNSLWGIFGKDNVPSDLLMRGSLERKARPYIVISTNEGNKSSTTCNLLPITRRSKISIPSQVQFFYNGYYQVILTEQPITANIDDLGNYMFTVNEEVLQQLEKGIAIQFGLGNSFYLNQFKELESRMTMLLKQASDNFLQKEKIFFVEYIKFFVECLSHMNTEEVDFLFSSVSSNSCYIECMKVPSGRCIQDA